jgi:cell division protein ZapA (FtsZ GTPase activity inhibitor)
MNSVKVRIGNKEYNLNGDKELIEKSAEEVNKHYKILQDSAPNLKIDALPILTALNIAESKINEISNLELEIELLKTQLNEMNTKLSSILN